MSKNHKYSRGFTVLELLVSLCISALIITAFIGGLAASGRNYLKWQEQQGDRAIYEIFRIWTQSGKLGCNSATGIRLCRLHENSIPLDALGFNHPISLKESARIRPTTADSHALTFLALELNVIFRRDYPPALLKQGQVYRISLCRNHSQGYANTSDYNYWLLRGPDGYLALEGSIRKRSINRSTCPGTSYEGSFRLDKNPMFANATPELKAAAPDSWINFTVLGTEHVQAVSQAYTLYVSKDGTLRRLAHDTSENQPLAEGVERIIRSEEKTGEERIALKLKRDNALSSSFPLNFSAQESSNHFSLVP